MESSFKFFTLFSAIVLTGLSAGLFYAWQVSVIPGLKKVIDMTYLESLQSINKAILNPGFFLSFFGCPILLIISSIQHHKGGPTFWLLICAFISYLFGTFGVTSFGNVPLNNSLELIELGELAHSEATTLRRWYESKWNRLHLIRTVFAVLSFALTAAALIIKSYN